MSRFASLALLGARAWRQFRYKGDPQAPPAARVRALRRTTLGFAAALSLLMLVVVAIMPGITFGKLVAFSSILLLAAIALWTDRAERLLWGAWGGVGLTLLAGFAAALRNGGVEGYVAPILLVPPIAAGYFLGRRAGALVTGAVMAALVLIYLIGRAGLVTPTPYPPEATAIGALALLLMAVALTSMSVQAFAVEAEGRERALLHGRERLQAREQISQLRANLQATFLRGNAPEAFERALASFKELTGSEYGFVGEVQHDPDGAPFLRTRAISEMSWGVETRHIFQERLANGIEFRNLDTLFGLALRSQAMVIANDAGSHPAARGVPPGHPPLKAFLGAPAFVAGEMVAMVGLANRPGGYDQALVETLQPLLDTLGQLIVASRAKEALARSEIALQEALAEKGRALLELSASQSALEATNRALLAERESLEQRVAERTSELQAALLAAEAASAAKSQFLAAMSHELRTPLNAIIGYSEMLQETAEIDQRQEDGKDLERVLRAARHLLRLINDVLDLSKVEAGKLALEFREVELREMLAEALDTVRPQAEANGDRLSLRCGPAPERVRTDPQKLRQALLNLLSNAVKFTREGEVALRAWAEAGRLYFEVSDTGCGIPAEVLPRLFRPFEQGDSSTTRLYGGTGLGLAITKRFAEALGGDVSVESRLGHGSRFLLSIRLPSSQAEAA